jgi:Cysteine rich repeat
VIAIAVSLLLAQAGHPCAADAQRLCKDVEPGQGRVAVCLKQHESELSAACQKRAASFREQVEQLTEACKNDAQKFCAGVRPGGGRIVRCLQQHSDQLSNECKAQGDKMHEQRAERREAVQQVAEACKPDAEKFCAAVQPGGGRIAQCLKQHQSELSKACTDAVQGARRR